MSTQILMPALSPTMSEGKLSKWLVKEGDIIKAGDLLAEIETDKAIMEFESSEDGTLKKILRNEGEENIKVNEPIALLETSSSLKKENNSKNIFEENKNFSKKETNEHPLDIASRPTAPDPEKQSRNEIFEKSILKPC